MDQQKWHTKIILKRLGLLFGLMVLEQLIFLLDPAISFSKMLFSSEQVKNMKHTVPLLFDPTFTATIKISLTVVLMVLLIGFLWTLVMKHDQAVHIDTTSPIRKLPKDKKPKIPTVLIVAVAWLAIFMMNYLGQAVRIMTSKDTTSANQAGLNSMANSVSSALWLFILGAFLIPIFEELIFRRLFIDFVGPSTLRKQFIIASVVLFAGAHMLGSTNIPADAIAYGGPAIVLAFLYVRFKNVRFGIYTHILVNTIAFSPLFVKVVVYIQQNISHYYDILTQGAGPGK